MTVTNLARFKINGTPSEDVDGKRGYDAEAGETLTLTLERNPALGVSTVTYSLHDASDSTSPLNSLYASELTFADRSKSITTSAVNSSFDVEIPENADISSYIFRASVVTATGQEVFERMVCIRHEGYRMTVPAETNQYSQRGWSDALNEAIKLIFGAVAFLVNNAAVSFLDTARGIAYKITGNRVLISVSVPDIATLQSDASYITAGTIRLDSRAVAGDGGHGVMRWNASDTRSPDGGAIVAVVGVATGRWNRDIRPDSWVSPLWFGAVQDDVAIDASPAIQACVTFCKNNWIKRIEIPSNVHIKTSIDLTPSAAPPGLTIRGYGKNAVIYTDCGNSPTFDCTGNHNHTFKSLCLRSLADVDSSALSSVDFFFARDDTNASAGGHVIEGCVTLWRRKLGHVVGCSSEVITLKNSAFVNTQPGTKTCYFSDQNDLGVASEYATLPEVFTGGNTVHKVIDCVIQAPGGASAVGLTYKSAQDIAIVASHQNGGGDAGMVLDGCVAIEISGGSTEWGLLSSVTHGLRLDNTVSGLSISGFTSTSDLYGSNASSVTGLSLIGTRFVNGISLYNVEDSPDLSTNLNGNGLIIRNVSKLATVASSATPNDTDVTLTVPSTHYGLTRAFRKLGSDGTSRYLKYLFAGIYDRLFTHGIFASYFGTQVQTIAGSGTIDFNPDLGSTCYSTLTGNVTISGNLAGSWNPAATGEMPTIDVTFVFRQDATGGRQVAWGGIWHPEGWIINPTPNSISTITFRFVLTDTLYFIRTSSLSREMNIENLAALRGSQEYIKTRNIILGYHTIPGYGGGNLWWKSDETSPDNNGTIFAVAGVVTGRWIRNVTGKTIDASWFGLHPTLSTALQTAAVQAAIDFVKSSLTTGTVLIPAAGDADYSLSTITMRAGVTLSGDAPVLHEVATVTRIVHAPATSGDHLIACEAPDGTGYTYAMHVKRLSLVGSVTSGDAIHWETPATSSVDDCAISDFPLSGVHLDGSMVCELNRNIINRCGLTTVNVVSVANASTTLTINGGYLRTSPVLMRLVSAGSVFCNGVHFESNNHSDSSDFGILVDSSQVTFVGCSAENVTDDIIRVTNSGAFSVVAGSWGGSNSAIASGSCLASIDASGTCSIVGAVVGRVDKTIKTTTNSGVISWYHNQLVTVSTSRWSSVFNPAKLIGDWDYNVSPTVSQLTAASVMMPDTGGNQVKWANAYHTVPGELHLIFTDSTGAVVNDAFVIDPHGNVLPNGFNASTVDDTEGFQRVTSTMGRPTGRPRSYPGRPAIHIDELSGGLEVDIQGAWCRTQLSAGSVLTTAWLAGKLHRLYGDDLLDFGVGEHLGLTEGVPTSWGGVMSVATFTPVGADRFGLSTIGTKVCLSGDSGAGTKTMGMRCNAMPKAVKSVLSVASRGTLPFTAYPVLVRGSAASPDTPWLVGDAGTSSWAPSSGVSIYVDTVATLVIPDTSVHVYEANWSANTEANITIGGAPNTGSGWYGKIGAWRMLSRVPTTAEQVMELAIWEEYYTL